MTTYPQDFLALWSVYASSRWFLKSSSKYRAWQAFDKCENRPPLDELIAGARANIAYLDDRNRNRNAIQCQMLPHLATWMNQRRWETFQGQMAVADGPQETLPPEVKSRLLSAGVRDCDLSMCIGGKFDGDVFVAGTAFKRAWLLAKVVPITGDRLKVA